VLKAIFLACLLGFVSACENPASVADGSISIVAEMAEYSVLPAGGYATIGLNLRIHNRSKETRTTPSLCD
jgi:hypothetical protein